MILNDLTSQNYYKNDIITLFMVKCEEECKMFWVNFSKYQKKKIYF